MRNCARPLELPIHAQRRPALCRLFSFSVHDKTLSRVVNSRQGIEGKAIIGERLGIGAASLPEVLHRRFMIPTQARPTRVSRTLL